MSNNPTIPPRPPMASPPPYPPQGLQPVKKVRVIDSMWTFSIAVVCVGPFALPLLWRNPRFKVSTKVIGSLVIIGITFFCIWALKAVTQMATQMGIQLDQIH